MLRYLWTHRCRPPLFSIPFLKAWAKRVLTLSSMLRMVRKRRRLLRGGASIGPDSCVGDATVEGKFAFLAVGNGTWIGRANLMLHDRIEIGSCVCINDGVTILTASHDIRDPKWGQISKPVVIEDFAWIATGATLLPGVRIGRGAVVGAGAVVSRDVPAHAVAAGNPAVVREARRSRDLSYNPVQFLAFQDAWLGKAVSGRMAADPSDAPST